MNDRFSHPSGVMETAQHLLGIVDSKELAGSDNPFEVAVALDLTIRATHLLCVDFLAEVADGFPASIQKLLAVASDEIDHEQDAFVEDVDYVGFIELLDLLSDENLVCIAPNLHKGWQDKTYSCRRARVVAQDVLGYSIDDSMRHSLTKAVAIQKRVLRIPGIVELDLREVKNSLSFVLKLLGSLAVTAKFSEIQKLVASLRGQI